VPILYWWGDPDTVDLRERLLIAFSDMSNIPKEKGVQIDGYVFVSATSQEGLIESKTMVASDAVLSKAVNRFIARNPPTDSRG